MKIEKMIFATGNEGKMREVRMILGDLGAEILSLKEAGIQAEAEENGTTFEENAVIKAKEIMEKTGALVLAGIYSERYMGHETSYHIKNKNLIERLEGKTGEERSARFVCAIAACFPDGRVLTTRGTMEGQIGYEEKGENGFGYDPIFYLPEYQCYSGELPLEEKNKLSHRGKALRLMKEQLEAL